MYFFGIILLVSYVQVAAAQSYDKNTCNPGPHNVPNLSPKQSPDIWYFQIPTTVDDGNDDDGMIMLEVNRTWAPIGADRFYSLAQDNYYDCAAFFRIVPDFIVQWGIASNPNETEKWDTNILDDPVVVSNTVGMVSFAMAGPDTRTTQLFVNTNNNSGLDGQGFAPFAKVVKGMDVFTAMYVPSPVPDQFTYSSEGNTWILQNYPDIDIIKGVSPKIFLSRNEIETSVTSSSASSSNEDDEDNMILDDDVDEEDGDINDSNTTSSSGTSASLDETAITDSSTSAATNKVASLNISSAGTIVSTTISCGTIIIALISSFAIM